MSRIILVFFLFLGTGGSTQGQAIWKHGRLTVSPDGHALQFADGTPFFWLGDTGWELFHRLSLEEIRLYLDNRQQKGFNVIQAVALAEFGGLTIPNRYGQLPLINGSPDTPNEAYFRLIDTVARMAEKRGLFLGLLPTWGDKVLRDWGVGPVVFNPENAYRYGQWLGTRYHARPNLIWILGGDRPAIRDSVDCRPVWRAMARGILDATGNQAFITYHPAGGSFSTSQFIHDEPWLSMNMLQSGHGGGHDVPVWNLIARDWRLSPAKPTLDAEPNYEDHPVNPWPVWDPATGYYRDYDVRKQLYRSVFSGACGVTYGHHSIWQFWSAREEKINHADRYWTEALNRPGARQAGYMRKLMESRPLLNRIPDTTIIMEGQGVGGERVCAFRDAAGTYLMVYLPVGKKIRVSTKMISGKKLFCWWFNPQTAATKAIGILENAGRLELAPATLGTGNDWVLVVEDAGSHYRRL